MSQDSPGSPGVAPNPTVVPDHELVELIGRGSYGEVWLARSALGTLRAVKIVRRARFDSERPYEREYSGIQRFEPISRSHEGLVDVLHVGRNDHAGFFYYVMELADSVVGDAPKTGFDLPVPQAGFACPNDASAPRAHFDVGSYEPRTLAREISARGRLPASELLPAFLTLASALAHLHQQGLLHRDIKPANIVFVDGVAKLADIGLVAQADQAATWVGTEGFIPPEGPGTRQADIYALGKVLYEACTGRDRLEYPSLPVDRTNSRQNHVLLELNAIFLKACARHPSSRYATADEMHADLALLQSGRSVKRHQALEASLLQARRVGLIASAVALFALAAVWFKSREAEVERRHRYELEGAYRDANVARARAERNSGRAGARQASLDAVAAAVRLRGPTPDARTEAITAMAMTDLRELRRQPIRSALANGAPMALRGDGAQLAQTDQHGGVYIYRVSPEAGEVAGLVCTLPGDGRMVQAVGPFSPDGSKLLIIAADGSEQVWDLPRGERILRLPPPPAGRLRVFTGDSRALAVRERDGRIALHDLRDGGVSTLDVGAAISGFAFTADHRWLAAPGATDSVVRIFALPAATPAAELALPAGVLGHASAFSPDGRQVAVSCSDFVIRVWDWGVTSAPLSELRGHVSKPHTPVFHPEGDLLVSTAYDGTTRLWDVRQGTPICLIPDASAETVFSADGKFLARLTLPHRDLMISALERGTVSRVFREGQESTYRDDRPQHASFSPDGALLVTATVRGAQLWDLRSGQRLAVLPGGDAYRAVFDGAGNAIWVSSSTRVLRWPISVQADRSWNVGPSAAVPLEKVWNLMPANDGESVFLASLGSRPLQRQSARGVMMRLTNSLSLWHATLSADGRTLAGKFLAGGVNVWDVESGALRQTFSEQRFSYLGLSPDGRWLYTTAFDEIARWDVASKRRAWTITNPVPLGNARTIACTLDGQLLATLLNDRQILLIDAETGRWIARLDQLERERIVSLAFSSDGAQLAAACPPGTVKVWDLRNIRRELAAFGLDWNHPPLPSPGSVEPPAQIRVVAAPSAGP